MKYGLFSIKRSLLVYLAFLSPVGLFLRLGRGGDNFSFLYGSLIKDSGMISDYHGFSLPPGRLILHLFPVISIGEALFNDHYQNGAYTMIRTKNKRAYFASKTLACLILNVIYMSIFALLALGLGGFEGEREEIGNFLSLMVSYLLENFLLSSFLLCISLLTSFRLGTCIFLADLSLAMLTNIQPLLGQASLAFKQDFLGGDFTFKGNLKLFAIYILLLGLIIIFLSPSYNFYGRKE